MPMFAVVFGEIVDSFNDPSRSSAERENAINRNVVWFIALGCVAFICHYLKV